MADQKVFLIYDDACRFCTGVKEGLERIRVKALIEFLPAHSPATQSQYPDLPLGDCLDAMFFIDEQKKVWKGALAFRELLRFVPLGSMIRWLYFIPGGTWFFHRLYGVIARNRFLFGKIPKGEEEKKSSGKPT